MLGRGEGRRRLAPEVVQTSAMDCGPAALACLLRGFGVPADYGRLREACQTDVDGTSIDTLEDIAVSLGLDAQQVMVPADTVLDPETDSLPAIVVMRLPNGFTHFVVAWRRHGRWVQVMDPAVGRRFMSVRRFIAETYRHAMPLPAEAWTGFACSDGFGRVLRGRLARLGVTEGEADDLVARADDADARVVLDAAGRTVQALSQAGAVAGRRRADTLRALLARPELVPDGFRQAVPAPPGDGDEPTVELRGAVLVRVGGRTDVPDPAALPPELAAAIGAPPPRPLRDLVARVAVAGRGRLAAATLGTVAAGAGVVVEALLFRHGFDLARRAEQNAGMAAALLAVLAGIAVLEWPVARALFGLGRRTETRLRLDFLAKLPRLHDRYLQSRPVSDMAERSHNLHRIRLLPLVGGGFVRAVAELCFTAAALVWLVPAAARPTAILVVVALVVALAFQPALNERDLRMRSHHGALGRLVLDALLGVVPVRAHHAAAAVDYEHRRLLDEWWRTGRAFQRAVAASEAVALAATAPLVAWLLLAHAPGGDPGRTLLFVYWAVALPVLGYEVGLLARQYPPMRNIALRLVEPLGAPEDEERSSPSPSQTPATEGPVGVRLCNVTALAGGHPVLLDVDLDIAPGAHVAVVGASGAGKSTLLGLLLGWHRPPAGEVLVDGLPLRGDVLDNLRASTAWVDPSVQLWNRSLLDNLRYGAAAELDLDAVVEAARLRAVVDALPVGVDTPLGEGGALVSGGEGQRVRLGRALHRPTARLVVLDEPFRGLDRPTRTALLAGARERWATATLLCATHDVAETVGFDRVLVVEGGRVVEDGTPADLAAQADSRYAALLAAEEAVRAALWDDPSWRRLRLDGGRVRETAGEGRR